MAHHSSQFSPEIAALFAREKARPSLGATGLFPEGKLTPTDEGETCIGITHMDGKVVIDFGKPTAWIGFTPDQADDIAALLTKHAAEAR
jgi:hypothetical protein